MHSLPNPVPVPAPIFAWARALVRRGMTDRATVIARGCISTRGPQSGIRWRAARSFGASRGEGLGARTSALPDLLCSFLQSAVSGQRRPATKNRLGCAGRAVSAPLLGRSQAPRWLVLATVIQSRVRRAPSGLVMHPEWSCAVGPSRVGRLRQASTCTWSEGT